MLVAAGVLITTAFLTEPVLAIAGLAQAWFDSVVEMEEAAASWTGTSAGLFVVEEHWLDPLA